MGARIIKIPCGFCTVYTKTLLNQALPKVSQFYQHSFFEKALIDIHNEITINKMKYNIKNNEFIPS